MCVRWSHTISYSLHDRNCTEKKGFCECVELIINRKNTGRAHKITQHNALNRTKNDFDVQICSNPVCSFMSTLIFSVVILDWICHCDVERKRNGHEKKTNSKSVLQKLCVLVREWKTNVYEKKLSNSRLFAFLFGLGFGQRRFIQIWIVWWLLFSTSSFWSRLKGTDRFVRFETGFFVISVSVDILWMGNPSLFFLSVVAN